MQQAIERHFDKILAHLYINPLEKCNLRCKICYTRKTNPILSQEAILTFVSEYQKVHAVETITFCGGEVFALSYFPKLINTLTKQGIFLQIITNGTLDVLSEIRQPNAVNLLVSIDGIESHHDANRGEGMYRRSIQFLQHAIKLGFHIEIFSIIHQGNIKTIDLFEQVLADELQMTPHITYHPRKPPLYLTSHPVSNIVGETDGFDFLTKEQMLQVMKERNVFPPPELGCYQVAVASDGKVYGCCEGTMPIGTLENTPAELIEALRNRVTGWEKTNHFKGCLGCSQPDFMCGIKQYLTQLHHET